MISGSNVETKERDFEDLLEYLKQNRCFDFTGYKRASLYRRVLKRMSEVKLDNVHEYLDYLQVHPSEFTNLFNTILINVTGFFRDPMAWERLATEALPRVLARPPEQAIRVWSAGCADGSEAYTLAMLLAEALGPDEFRRRVKIYATDVDEEALSHARHAGYSARSLAGVPEALADKYFERTGNLHSFRGDLRRSVIFGCHDLLGDAPISRLDLLVCRNTLMYFNAEAQQRILGRFHYALSEGGLLFLGRAEMLLTGSQFAPLDLKQRIFTKVSQADPRNPPPPAAAAPANAAGQVARLLRLRELSLEHAPVPQLLVDSNGSLLVANLPARVLFGLTPRDLARPFQDLEVSYRPVDLRSCIDQAYAERRSIQLPNVERSLPGGRTQFLDVQVQPLLENDKPTGVSITFLDVSRANHLQQELQRAHQELETANEELQSTNEELETTNEELQSTVEELETTNEELQSTNEELETMNEELQSTNEELQTMNDELSKRTEESIRATSFLQSILTGLRSAVIVVDRNLCIQVWNQEAEELWGLRSDETVGKFLLNLDIGLPLARLTEVLRNVLGSDSQFREVDLDATNRRGKAIHCHVVCTPLLGARNELQGAIIVLETDTPSARHVQTN